MTVNSFHRTRPVGVVRERVSLSVLRDLIQGWSDHLKSPMIGLRTPEGRILIIQGVDKFTPTDMESFQLSYGLSQVFHHVSTYLLQYYYRYDDRVFVGVK